MCVVTITYNEIAIPGLSAGDSYNLTVTIDVPNGDYVGEFVADGSGFSPCPGVTQYLVRARNGGDIVGQFRSSSCHNLVFVSSSNSCEPTVEEYDCLNGACTKKDVYDTPGIYKSLSECEQACGTGCSGKCISNADWAKIEGLSGLLKRKNCS